MSPPSRRSDRLTSASSSENREGGPLSRAHRLQHRWEFLRFFNGAEVFRLSECLIFRIPNDRGHFRLGITLKTRGSSVERNKVKRVVRESLRKMGDSLGAYDYNVVIPRGKNLSFPYPEKLKIALTTEFRNALSRR